MVKLFKNIATYEGISLLLLLFICMPLKYIFGILEPVKYVGWAHGVLFIAYIVLAIVIKGDMKWNIKTFLFVCIASVIPFGTFYMENKLLKNV